MYERRLTSFDLRFGTSQIKKSKTVHRHSYLVPSFGLRGLVPAFSDEACRGVIVGASDVRETADEF
jgi:hypothetical protein